MLRPTFYVKHTIIELDNFNYVKALKSQSLRDSMYVGNKDKFLFFTYMRLFNIKIPWALCMPTLQYCNSSSNLLFPKQLLSSMHASSFCLKKIKVFTGNTLIILNSLISEVLFDGSFIINMNDSDFVFICVVNSFKSRMSYISKIKKNKEKSLRLLLVVCLLGLHGEPVTNKKTKMKAPHS